MRFLPKSIITYFILLFSLSLEAKGQISFCAESVPIQKSEVKNRFLRVLERTYKKGGIAGLYRRASIYFPYVEEMLFRHAIPDDFKYLPLIESAFFTVGPNKAGAAGVWQIIPETAVMFGGLEINDKIDERLDFEKSTLFAIKLIRWLYERLGSWTLVAAAYNGGIGRIEGEIKRTGNRDYYSMNLCMETAEYVLKMVACKELFNTGLNEDVVLRGVFEISPIEPSKTYKKETPRNTSDGVFNSKVFEAGLKENNSRKNLDSLSVSSPE